MRSIESILSKLRSHFLKGCVAVCDVALDCYARNLEREGLSDDKRWEIRAEMDFVARDKHVLQLFLDLMERKPFQNPEIARGRESTKSRTLLPINSPERAQWN